MLRPIGQPCSWGRTYGHQLWRMSRSPSASSDGSEYPSENPSNAPDDDDDPSSEDDYL